MVDGHAMNRSKTVVIGEVEEDNMNDQRAVRGVDFVFGTEVNWNVVLPFFELAIQLTNGVEKFPISLSRCLG
jgi:hypothetical protein